MTACLRTGAATSTPLQRKKIAIEAKRRGLDLQTVRDIAGVASLKELSSDSASALITRICGQSLPNPPGQKPRTRRRALPSRARKEAVSTRMITPNLVEQLDRLGCEYFDDVNIVTTGRAAFYLWLKKNFKVESLRDLATAKRAGEVIAVLKGMLDRKKKGKDSHASL